MRLEQAAKAYDNEELKKHLRLVWKHFGKSKNQVSVKSVTLQEHTPIGTAKPKGPPEQQKFKF